MNPDALSDFPDIGEILEASLRDLKSPQELLFTAIENEIRDFERNLDPELETAFRSISDPYGRIIYIRQIEFLDGGVIIYRGVTEEGENAAVIQHFTQANILFQGVKKLSQEKVQIGFIWHKQLVDSTSG